MAEEARGGRRHWSVAAVHEAATRERWGARGGPSDDRRRVGAALDRRCVDARIVGTEVLVGILGGPTVNRGRLRNGTIKKYVTEIGRVGRKK